VEALLSGTPTVCVPRVVPRTEQLLRAQAFARQGLIRLLRPGDLEPSRLRREVLAALDSSREQLRKRARAVLDFEGAAKSGRELIWLATQAGANPGRVGTPAPPFSGAA